MSRYISETIEDRHMEDQKEVTRRLSIDTHFGDLARP